MASEAIKRMIFKQMFEQGAAKRRAKAAQDIYGNAPVAQGAGPNVPFENDQTFPGEQPLPGLMNLSEAQPGTGMFNTEIPAQQRILELNQRRNASGDSGLQNQALQSMQALESTMLSASGSAGIQRERYDPNTQVSEDARSRASELFPDVNFAGLSAVDVMGMLKTQQAKQRIDAKPEAADVLAESKRDLERLKTTEGIEEAANNKLLSVYGEDLDQSNKFKPTLDTVDRILELGGKVETGKLVGSAPAVWLRTMFGNDELQELESLIKGLPLPILKATFGAAFSVKEGETLATSLANVGMDAKAFKNAMNRMKAKLVYDERRFKQKKRYFDKNRGNLMGFKENVPYPKDLKAFDDSEKEKANKTVSWGDL